MRAAMASHPEIASAPRAGRMSFNEFVAFVAATFALNALAIDVMIPALPHMAEALNIAQANDRQAVIIVYLAGFSVAQLFFGPLSDRFGRRRVLLFGLALFCVAGFVSTIAQTYGQLLAARLVQGLGGAASRVIAMSLVRDRYSGREMGRVMSLAITVFMAVPILAPSVGQLVLLVAPWRGVFGILVIASVAMFAWTWLRLDESLPLEQRQSLAPGRIAGNYLQTMRHRITAGYTLAIGVSMAALMGFVTSAQQIFVDVFGIDGRFTLLFAAIALSMSGAAFTNAQLVRRIGLRRLSHGALILFILIHSTHYLLASNGWQSLGLFMLMQALGMFVYGFLGANFNAIAMQAMGHIAGTAAAMIGFSSTALSACVGYLIGGAFDLSVVPLAAGSALAGCAALMIILVAERGRLFSKHD